MLTGLSPTEHAWLTRKAAYLGGLQAALRFLLRQGLMCETVARTPNTNTTPPQPTRTPRPRRSKRRS